MHAMVALLFSTLLSADATVATKFAQVSPAWNETAPFSRSAEQTRAVLLIHGLLPHPFSDRNVAQAHWQYWQWPSSTLVKTLAKEADIYAFAYSQNVAVEEIAAAPQLAESIRTLRQLGYREIVLVGHSAGGLVARHFVEDVPDAGVTKVVQVCAPNGGSHWAKAHVAVRESQEVFLDSFSKGGRQKTLALRPDKKVPGKIEFVCLVGNLECGVEAETTIRFGRMTRGVHVAVSGRWQGDGLVATDCQWTADLQEQRIPVAVMEVDHLNAIRSAEAVAAIAKLVREPQPRWTAEQVAAAKERLLGKP